MIWQVESYVQVEYWHFIFQVRKHNIHDLVQDGSSQDGSDEEFFYLDDNSADGRSVYCSQGLLTRTGLTILEVALSTGIATIYFICNK